MRLPDTIFIDINSQFEGEVTLESGVSILGDSKIVNSHIKSNSIVESSIVKDSEVGPMARVRPESQYYRLQDWKLCRGKEIDPKWGKSWSPLISRR